MQCLCLFPFWSPASSQLTRPSSRHCSDSLLLGKAGKLFTVQPPPTSPTRLLSFFHTNPPYTKEPPAAHWACYVLSGSTALHSLSPLPGVSSHALLPTWFSCYSFLRLGLLVTLFEKSPPMLPPDTPLYTLPAPPWGAMAWVPLYRDGLGTGLPHYSSRSYQFYLGVSSSCLNPSMCPIRCVLSTSFLLAALSLCLPLPSVLSW